MKRKGVVVLTVAIVAVAGTLPRAHHSAANYDTSKSIALQGTVTEFKLANPHPSLYFKVAPGSVVLPVGRREQRRDTSAISQRFVQPVEIHLRSAVDLPQLAGAFDASGSTGRLHAIVPSDCKPLTCRQIHIKPVADGQHECSQFARLQDGVI